MNPKNLKPQNEWYLNEPEELVAFVYWQRGKIPTNTKEAIKDVATQLNKNYPCPEEYKSKWGLEDE